MRWLFSNMIVDCSLYSYPVHVTHRQWLYSCVGKALTTGTERNDSRQVFYQLSLFTRQISAGTLLSQDMEKVKGGEEEEWCPTLVTPLSETVGC